MFLLKSVWPGASITVKTACGCLEFSYRNVDGQSSFSLNLQLVKHLSVLERSLVHFIHCLFKLLNFHFSHNSYLVELTTCRWILRVGVPDNNCSYFSFSIFYIFWNKTILEEENLEKEKKERRRIRRPIGYPTWSRRRWVKCWPKDTSL